jgi:hypothetical protein
LLDLAVLKLKLSKYSIGASSPKTGEWEMIRNKYLMSTGVECESEGLNIILL